MIVNKDTKHIGQKHRIGKENVAITLNELCKYAKENYNMKLIAGENNMNTLVQWVHLIEDNQAATFLRGNELIFTTGIGQFAGSTLLHFVQELKKVGASGLVVNIGPYIPSVSTEVIAFCKEQEFPLFTVPWSVRLVDITYAFCHHIIQKEENAATVSDAFKNAIFSPKDVENYKPVLERMEFNVSADFCIIGLAIVANDETRYMEYEKQVQLYVQKILIHASDKFNVFSWKSNLIIVLQDFPKKEIDSSMNQLIEKCNEKGKGFSLYVGISNINTGLKSLGHSYTRAMAVVRMAVKQKISKLWYESLGLYKILIALEDHEELSNLYRDVLGKLEEYDKEKGTDYMDTLWCYLKSNASVQEVAKKTFVHRNTINYKLKRIKEILECDLTYEDNLQILMAFYIRNIL